MTKLDDMLIECETCGKSVASKAGTIYTVPCPTCDEETWWEFCCDECQENEWEKPPLVVIWLNRLAGAIKRRNARRARNS